MNNLREGNIIDLSVRTCDFNSSLIKNVYYSYFPQNGIKINQRMLVSFNDGRVYEYYSFEDIEKLYNDFISAPSVGKFWHTNIKDKIEYKKLR